MTMSDVFFFFFFFHLSVSTRLFGSMIFQYKSCLDICVFFLCFVEVTAIRRDKIMKRNVFFPDLKISSPIEIPSALRLLASPAIAMALPVEIAISAYVVAIQLSCMEFVFGSCCDALEDCSLVSKIETPGLTISSVAKDWNRGQKMAITIGCVNTNIEVCFVFIGTICFITLRKCVASPKVTI